MAAAAPPPPGHRSYMELFSDPTSNPLGAGAPEGYREVYARWRIHPQPPSGANVLRDAAMDLSDTVGGIAMFMEDPDSSMGVLKVIYGLDTYKGRLGRASAYRGRVFAYLDEVVGVDIQSVALPADQFELTDEIIIPGTPERMQELLNEEPNEDRVGPIKKNAAIKATVRTRKSMFIPRFLLPLVFNKDLTPRQVWEVCYPAIVDEGMEVICAPFLIFLMVTLTQATSQQRLPLTVHRQVGEAGINVPPEVHSERREKVLYVHLPALKPHQGSDCTDPQMAQLISHVANVSDNMRKDRIDRKEQREKAGEPTTVREKFGEHTADMLLQMTGADDDDEVPDLYLDLAARKKGESKRLVFQRAVDKAARSLGVRKPFTVTSTQVLALDNFDFVGAGKEELGTGLSAYTIVPPGGKSTKCKKTLAEERLRSHQFDMSGDPTTGTISTADAKKLIHTKGYIPTEWNEADSQLEQQGVLLGALLGPEHPNVKAHMDAVEYYDGIKTDLQHNLENKYGKQLAPALLVFHFHLPHRNWFDRQWTSLQTKTLRPPDLISGMELHQMSNRTDWMPEFSNVPALLILNQPAPSPTPAPAPAPSPRPGEDRTNDRNANRNASRRLRNPSRDPRYVGNGALAVAIRNHTVTEAIDRATAAGHPPPTYAGPNGERKPRCLSWHVKGVCLSTCDQEENHHPLDEPATEELHQWCVPAFA